MEFIAKSFDTLSTTELYEILKSRSQIFMLEQNIICQDMDDVDYKSLHCFYYDKNRVVAYLRAFESEEPGTFVIGRVLTLEHRRGLGTRLMTDTIELLETNQNLKKICIHAQVQAVGFYERLGFLSIGEEFMEEGVAHVTMQRVSKRRENV